MKPEFPASNRLSTGTSGADLVPLRFYLRLEGLVSMAAATCVYANFSFSWWLYALLFFVPDFFMLGYVSNERVGAFIYNLGHTYAAPALVFLISLLGHSSIAGAVGLIWWAHIGFDRLLGFGLKHDSGFKNTHLDRL